MRLNFITEKIELYYKQYCEQGSENTFNGFTDFFFDKLSSLPLCKELLEEIASKYDITEENFEIRQEQCIYEFLIDIFNKGEEYYVAYCYRYYYFLRKQKESGYNAGETYYDDVKWTDKGIKENGDKVSLFKTDFIRPIVNYLTGNLKSESVILYHLQKYKARVERFKSIRYSPELNELSLQRDMALFLFDQHLDFWKEVDTCDGRIDFFISGKSEAYGTILECNDKPYVVEIKYFDKKEDLYSIEDAKGQLRIYLGQVPAYGCLLIYTNDDTDYDLSDWSDNQITVISIYIGAKTPSRRHFRLQDN